MTDEEQQRRAIARFKSYHGRAPRSSELAKLKFIDGEIALEIGKCVGIMYKTKEEAKPFLHRFNKRNRPLLFVSADGKQLYILQGGYRFTDRGIVG